MQKLIVVSDPQHNIAPGSLVTEDRAHALRAHGVVLLPVEASLFRLSGNGGFTSRDWGSGWPIDGQSAQAHGPLVLYLTPEVKRIHWAARFNADRELGALSGGVMFSTDSSQRAGRIVPGWLPDTNCRQLSPRDLGDKINGEWGWSGAGDVLVHAEGFYSFAIYGVCSGLRLVSLAASATF